MFKRVMTMTAPAPLDVQLPPALHAGHYQIALISIIFFLTFVVFELF